MTRSVGLVRYGAAHIDYEVLESPRRKTLGIEVHPDQRVLVRAPRGCDANVIAERVRKRAQWINRQRALFRAFNPRTPPRYYLPGETHLYLGRQYRLHIEASKSNAVALKRGVLAISVTETGRRDQTQHVLNGWYRERAKDVFQQAMNDCMQPFTRKGHAKPPISVRTMVRRWGSLSESGTMTLNVDLIRAPRACIEYVVTHELCHLEHGHHGAAFYKLLVRIMPDWERRKQRLETVLL